MVGEVCRQGRCGPSVSVEPGWRLPASLSQPLSMLWSPARALAVRPARRRSPTPTAPSVDATHHVRDECLVGSASHPQSVAGSSTRRLVDRRPSGPNMLDFVLLVYLMFVYAAGWHIEAGRAQRVQRR